MRSIRIGAGAGYAGDRIEPAVELAEKGRLDYLVFECLAERTIALAQQEKRKDPSRGYDPLLSERMRRVLEPCRTARHQDRHQRGGRQSGGGGASRGAGDRPLARPGAGCASPPSPGDDVLGQLEGSLRIQETGGTLADLGDRVVSANAYIGAQPVAEALARGADVVITGRVADTAIFMAPLVHEFGWSMEDWDAARPGNARRPPPRVRRAGHGRLLRRSRSRRTSRTWLASASRSARWTRTARS